jgi:hypothetical protein
VIGPLLASLLTLLVSVFCFIFIVLGNRAAEFISSFF